MNKIKRLFSLILLDIAGSRYVTHKLRLSIYRCLGANIGESTIIEYGCTFSNPDLSTFVVGTNTYINHRNYFDNNGYIGIGSNCAIAMNCYFHTTTHDLKLGDGRKRVRGKAVVKDIGVDSGCWIGTGSRLLPGSYIAEGCVLGAGSLVTKRLIYPNALYYGVPANFARYLDSDKSFMKEFYQEVN